MAIHPTVMGTPDRRIRIELQAQNTLFVVYENGRQIGMAGTLADLSVLLAEYGVNLADLEEQ
jgi:hypothetical protein